MYKELIDFKIKSVITNILNAVIYPLKDKNEILTYLRYIIKEENIDYNVNRMMDYIANNDYNLYLMNKDMEKRVNECIKMVTDNKDLKNEYQMEYRILKNYRIFSRYFPKKIMQ
uniref:Uncharacterized protein n=1 Tax=viral metagenome TaxID=1070528 RepID=A0A6C0H4W7_9ZZZZ